MRYSSFLDALDHDRIVAAIRAAEARSRGEIRVHVARKAVARPQRAAALAALGVTATAERNGVLIFVAPRSRNLAVIGDEDVHARCGDAFWGEVVRLMEVEFAAGRFTEGIVRAVERVGDMLAEHYPRPEGGPDRNELPDTITEG